MNFRYFVSYRYNDEDHAFGCNTLKHIKEITRKLSISGLKIYDYQLERYRELD